MLQYQNLNKGNEMKLKLKFVLVLLVVFGFAVGSYADGLKWITPSKSVCIANGGEMKDGVCKANWENAKNICRVNGGRLPSKDELRSVVIDCGGIIDDYDKNIPNLSYQSCYKKKGFSSSYYYSSTVFKNVFYKFVSSAWVVRFYNGGMYSGNFDRSNYVRCVRDGQ